MQILIDNKDIYSEFGITILDYTKAFDFAAERENERVWADKSGVDKNLENIKYDSKEFVLSFLVKADNEVQAYNQVKTLVQYMYQKGVFVLSFRDTQKDIREAFICERSNTIVGNINIRAQNSLYISKIGLKDINPNAIRYYTDISEGVASINYEKGQTAVLYWGDGSRDLVSNSGTYTKSDYISDGPVDVFIDLDQDANVVSPITAAFSAIPLSGNKPLQVIFTDESSGTPEIWSWDFGDGTTSDQQNPSHTYQETGAYTVTLQIFNSAGGFDTEEKIDYIVVSDSGGLINDSGDLGLLNDSGDLGIIN